MPLSRRILLPYILLITAVLGASAAISILQARRTAESRIRDLAGNLGLLLQGGRLPVGDESLRRVRETFGVDCRVESPAGAGSTFGLDEEAELARPEAPPVPAEGEYRTVGRRALFLLPIPATEGGDFQGLVAVDRRRVDDESSRLAFPFVVYSVVGLGLALFVGLWLTRGVVRPLAALAERTPEIAAGRLDAALPPPSGIREIDRLSAAFESMLAGLRDYRERLRREEARAASARVAEAIAHDIKNPLATVRLHLELLGRGQELSADDRRLLVTEIDRVARSIDELMASFRGTEGDPEPVRLDEIAREAVEAIRPRAVHAGIELTLRIEATPPIRGRRAALSRAVRNVVQNAVEAVPRGGRIEVAVVEREGAVDVSVSDDGPGVAPESAKRLFEAGYSTKEGGTGLGLSIARDVAAGHGGSVAYEALKPGARFRMSIPVARTAARN